MSYKLLTLLGIPFRSMHTTLTPAAPDGNTLVNAAGDIPQSYGPSSDQGREPLSIKPRGNTILVTGGGSGIGRELARRLHEQGNTVLVAGRTMSTLQETIGERKNMSAYALNVGDPAEIAAFAKHVVAGHPDLNVLINNAGIMHFEDLSTHNDLSDAEAQVTINLLGPIRLTNALIEHLKRQPNPAIVNVTSGLAFVPRADAAVYAATKAALHTYTLALRNQLQDKVKIVEIVPPAVQTELTPGQSDREGYMPLDEFMDEVMTIFAQQPTPDEVLVSRVSFLRWAEREGRFNDAFEKLNVQAGAAKR